MSNPPRYAFPRIGRAGLGNELYPLARAAEYAEAEGVRLIPPYWMQPRIGPFLRGERDRRQYWRIFRRPTPAQLAIRLGIHTGIVPAESFTGMAGFFADLQLPGAWHREWLATAARPGQLTPRTELPTTFVSAHIRLGDFARANEDATEVAAANSATPLRWFRGRIDAVRTAVPGLPVLISSDGSDEELADLLALEGVDRTTARNALDEMLIMSHAAGILGSRSTFSAWSAFLGNAPLLVAPGANAFQPHGQVWEYRTEGDDAGWLAAVGRRLG